MSTLDIVGGAQRIAWNLHNAYRERGHHSWLIVGRKLSHDPDVLQMQDDMYCSHWTESCLSAETLLLPAARRIGVTRRFRRLVQSLGQLHRLRNIRRGYEDFDFPGARHLLRLVPQRPDVVHCHNLHGNYFDLRTLPWLSRKVPVVLTLHDAWLLSGHCAHSFGCERWKTGCHGCPDLTIYPAISRDEAAHNWRVKQRLFERCRLYVSAPSRWLMDKVTKSMLAPAIVESKVIPNGVDLTVFHPGDQGEARRLLSIASDASVMLFVGNGTRSSPWGDYATLEASVERLSKELQGKRLLLICVGEERMPERIGRSEVLFVGYQNTPRVIADYYRAADVHVHPSRVDTFPTTVLEALACGVPVVSTAVGGIPEQVIGLNTGDSASRIARIDMQGADGATGVLVPPGDPEMMAAAIGRLLSDEVLRGRLGKNAARDARRRFDLQRQVDEYLDWYKTIIESTEWSS